MPASLLGGLAAAALKGGALGGGAMGLKRFLAYRSAQKARSRVGQKYVRKIATKVSGVNRMPMTFPRQTIPRGMNRDFTYCYDGQIHTGTSQNIYGPEDQFKLNDCFDPAVGAASTQPLFWDQFSALYSRYRVYAATVEVRWQTTDTSNITACACLIQPSTASHNVTGQNTAFVSEMPMCSVIRIAPGGEHNWIVGPKRFTMSEIEGSKSWTTDDDFAAQVTASPAVSPTLRLACANRNGTDDVYVYYTIRITYHTHLYDPKIPSQS